MIKDIKKGPYVIPRTRLQKLDVLLKASDQITENQLSDLTYAHTSAVLRYATARLGYQFEYIGNLTYKIIK